MDHTERASVDRPAFTEAELRAIHDAVLRTSTDAPGFWFGDFGPDLDSHRFRRLMIDLSEGLGRVAATVSGRRLGYQWVGRFDHRHSSMFHRDNAAARSVLLLGYEPTTVDSTVAVADYTRYAEDEGITLVDYFGGEEADNVAANDERLAPYATELAPFPNDSYRLLVLNNSKSFAEPSFGVFHRGRVQASDGAADRVINSIMLTVGDDDPFEPDADEILDFIATDQVAR